MGRAMCWTRPQCRACLLVGLLRRSVYLTFEDLGGKTRMTLNHIGMPAGQGREHATFGFDEAFDKLARSLTVEQ